MLPIWHGAWARKRLWSCQRCPLLPHRWTHGRQLAGVTQTESTTGTQKTVRVQKEEGRDRRGSEELRGSRSGEERVRRV